MLSTFPYMIIIILIKTLLLWLRKQRVRGHSTLSAEPEFKSNSTSPPQTTALFYIRWLHKLLPPLLISKYVTLQ